MRVIIIVGTEAEVAEYFNGPSAHSWHPSPVKNPARLKPKWEPDPTVVEKWATDIVGRELRFGDQGGDDLGYHRCVAVGWRPRKNGVVLQCEHDGEQYRQYPHKVMRPVADVS